MIWLKGADIVLPDRVLTGGMLAIDGDKIAAIEEQSTAPDSGATLVDLTGSLVVERIFQISGMGSHFIEAATQRDYTLAMGMVLVYTFLLYVMNALVDLSYAIIDPRVKAE